MAVDEQYAQALRELATAKLAVRLLVRALRQTPGGAAAVGRLAIEQPELMKAVMALAAGVAPSPAPRYSVCWSNSGYIVAVDGRTLLPAQVEALLNASGVRVEGGTSNG